MSSSPLSLHSLSLHSLALKLAVHSARAKTAAKTSLNLNLICTCYLIYDGVKNELGISIAKEFLAETEGC